MLSPRDVIRLEPGAVVMLDQTRLPRERVDRRCETVGALVEAIRSLAIRGAPALGVAGAMGMALAAERSRAADIDGLRRELELSRAALAGSRPTAVNLGWALAEAQRVVDAASDPDRLRADLRELAERVHREEEERCRAMGEHGAQLLPRGARVLTHCNAGALATGGYGSALGVVRAAFERDPSLHVWVDETRPLLQGARLTAWELAEDGIPHTLIADVAAGQLFARGPVDAGVFGADRLPRDGGAAHKVGSYTLSGRARAHAGPLYVVPPTAPDAPPA